LHFQHLPQFGGLPFSPCPPGPDLTHWSQSPWAPLTLWPPASWAFVFLAARDCTLTHLYHRKQKTSLTSHLFHRWESNSLLNDCPEPTIQRGGIYSAARDQGALPSHCYIRELQPFSSLSPVSLKRKAIKYD
jgi:hypothetical protein